MASTTKIGIDFYYLTFSGKGPREKLNTLLKDSPSTFTNPESICNPKGARPYRMVHVEPSSFPVDCYRGDMEMIVMDRTTNKSKITGETEPIILADGEGLGDFTASFMNRRGDYS